MKLKHLIAVILMLALAASCTSKKNRVYEQLKIPKTVDFKTASELYAQDELVRKNPGDLKLRLTMAKLFYSAGFKDRALSNYMDMLKKMNPDVRTRYLLYINIGNIYDDFRNYPEAVKYYNTAIAQLPDEDIAYYNLGLTYSNMGDGAKAEEYYNKTLEINPDNVKALKNIAALRLEKGEIDRAIGIYQNILAANPDDENASFNLAVAYIKGGSEQEGIDLLLESIKTAIDKKILAESYLTLGKIFYEKKDFFNAVNFFEKAVQFKPADAELRYLLGMAYVNNNQKYDAITQFNEIIYIDTGSIKAYMALGMLYLKTENLIDKAAGAFEKVIEREPTNSFAYYQLGYIYNLQRNTKKAMEAFTRVINLSPQSADALNSYINIGNIYDDQKNFNKAIETYMKALDLDSGNPSIYFNLGVTSFNAGRYDNAVNYYKTALEINPSDSRILTNLGIVYYKIGDIKKAITAFEAAIDIEPNVEAIYNLKKIKAQEGF